MSLREPSSANVADTRTLRVHVRNAPTKRVMFLHESLTRHTTETVSQLNPEGEQGEDPVERALTLDLGGAFFGLQANLTILSKLLDILSSTDRGRTKSYGCVDTNNRRDSASTVGSGVLRNDVCRPIVLYCGTSFASQIADFRHTKQHQVWVIGPGR